MKTQRDDLEVRVTERKRQLILEIIEHKKNSCRVGAADAIDRITHQLLDLSRIMNANKYAALSAGARLRLADWVAR